MFSIIFGIFSIFSPVNADSVKELSCVGQHKIDLVSPSLIGIDGPEVSGEFRIQSVFRSAFTWPIINARSATGTRIELVIGLNAKLYVNNKLKEKGLQCQARF